MKKISVKLSIIIICLCIMTFITTKFINVNAEVTWYTTSKEIIDVGYGVTIDKIIGHGGSTFNPETDGYRNQVIHTANISKDSPARVVQWSEYGMVDNYWGTYTLDMIAEDYEEKHPNEKVLVATNNWLNYHTSKNSGEICSPQIAGGLNYRVSNKNGTPDNYNFSSYITRKPNILAFTSSGKEIVYGDDFYKGIDYTENLIISFFDSKTYTKTPLGFEITKVNEEPSEGEIAIYFNNYGGEKTVFEDAKIFKLMASCLRHDTRNSTTPVERDVFALGSFDSIVNEVIVDYNVAGYYAYYIVSKNDEFNKLDLSIEDILVQHELIGKYEDVIGGTSFKEMLVIDGVPYGEFTNEGQMDKTYHPRTTFIVKEDGTFALSVIDGRQENMVGMDYEEMGYFYKENYNAYQVFNYDGGGSSCMIMTNSNGGFNVLNSPSDGHVRGIANATLIVVDKEPYEISLANPHESVISLNVDNIADNVTKIFATLNNEKKEVINGRVEFTNLEANKNYNIKFTYVIDEVEYNGSIFNCKTSNPFVRLSSYEIYDITQNSIKVKYQLEDLLDSFSSVVIKVNNVEKELNTLNGEVEFTNLEYLTDYVCEFKVYSKTYTDYLHEINYDYPFKTAVATYAEKIVINDVNTTIKVGDVIKLIPDTYPSGMINKFNFESTNQSIIKINQKGRLKAVGEGVAQVRIFTDSGLELTVTFVVENNPNKGCSSSNLVYVSLLSSVCLIYLLKKKQ